MRNWLSPENIHIRHDITDWRDAVQASAEPLLEQRAITQDYVQAIFAQHEKLGPYYVLAPGIAMLHARPEEGANALGLSLLTLPHGVKFNSEGNDPIYTLVMLAAPDKHSHIELISELAELNLLGGMFEHAFNIQGIIPNNEAIVSIVLDHSVRRRR